MKNSGKDRVVNSYLYTMRIDDDDKYFSKRYGEGRGDLGIITGLITGLVKLISWPFKWIWKGYKKRKQR